MLTVTLSCYIRLVRSAIGKSPNGVVITPDCNVEFSRSVRELGLVAIAALVLFTGKVLVEDRGASSISSLKFMLTVGVLAPFFLLVTPRALSEGLPTPNKAKIKRWVCGNKHRMKPTKASTVTTVAIAARIALII